MVVPTETVYGVACDPAVPGALIRLQTVKGRDATKPLARLVAGVKPVLAAVPHWSDGMQRLADRFWPGPLTMVVETPEGWVGFRVPAHAVALGLAAGCVQGLALTSANRSGTPDTRTAQEAQRAIKADLVLDAGPSAEHAVPSTVVRVAATEVTCLREGVVPFEAILRVFEGRKDEENR